MTSDGFQYSVPRVVELEVCRSIFSKDYVVPHSPDKAAINNLYMSLIERVL